MKKFSLLLIAFVLSFTSCTNEDSASTNETSTFVQKSGSSGDPTIDGLFAKMQTSRDYIDLQIMRKNFADKMNFVGTYNDIKTSANVLNWIDINIASTDFVDFVEAKSELLAISTLSNTVVANNWSLYELVGQQPNPGQTWVDLEGVALMSSDPCGCGAQFELDVIDAAMFYQLGMEAAYQADDYEAASDIIGDTNHCYIIQTGAAATAYDACMQLGCD